MKIDFVSSLPPDEEERIIAKFVGKLVELLDELPIAYSLRVKAASGEVFDHSHVPDEDPGEGSGSGSAPENR